jgi:hypothetical protein
VEIAAGKTVMGGKIFARAVFFVPDFRGNSVFSHQARGCPWLRAKREPEGIRRGLSSVCYRSGIEQDKRIFAFL